MKNNRGRPSGLEGPMNLSEAALRGGPLGKRGQSPNGSNLKTPFSFKMDKDENIFVKYNCGSGQQVDEKYIADYIQKRTAHSSVVVNILEWMD